ncbi:MAG: bifunctional 5,10-methylenetetrahydrofolate dehydrogenase/5,10-methenyltetrahydrofolate cyclohydrolase [Chloroflexi bacterium]|nr:bifunctional 5,10-methylenetetrahydrofolate dehydrogenase/5,10-methenyltetrahydrofolate cyclohydrolase [Chloroflexota bacterium]
MKLLKGDVVAAEIKAAAAEQVRELTTSGAPAPSVAIVDAAAEAAAHVYVGQVERSFKQAGIQSRRVTLAEGSTTEDLIAAIERLAKDDDVQGILIPTPLPKGMSLIAAQDAMPPDKDIEGIGSTNVGRLALGQPKSVPATPLGGMEILRHYKIPIEGSRAVVLGRSAVVGWPMATLLQQAGATVTICHSKTRELGAVTRGADILVAATGRAGIVTADMVKSGAIVIDFGVNMTARGMVGDVDFEPVSAKAAAITPVPGGTGVVTTAVLVRNVVDTTLRQRAAEHER